MNIQEDLMIDNIKDLLQKLFSGQLTPDEWTGLWQRRDVTRRLEQQWNDSTESAADPAREARIWKQIEPQVNPSALGPAIPLWRRSLGIAASVALAVGIGLSAVNIIWRPAPETIRTIYSGNQSTQTISLPDGSTLQLGANSSCTYSDTFKGDERLVKLTGQGFFEVAKDPSKPFVVEAEHLRITALGTAFEVFSDMRTDHTEAILLNGRIKITLPGVSAKEYFLSPEEKFSYIATTRSVRIDPVDAGLYSSWRNSRTLNFENQPLSMILPRLERWYNCHIDCPEEIAERHYFTFTLFDESLDRTLELLRSSVGRTSLHCIRTGNHVQIYETAETN